VVSTQHSPDVSIEQLREAIAAGRHNYPFCKYCDFIDAGLRMDAVDDVLKHREMHGARQSMFKKK
jgi:hypothetical protein